MYSKCYKHIPAGGVLRKSYAAAGWTNTRWKRGQPHKRWATLHVGSKKKIEHLYESKLTWTKLMLRKRWSPCFFLVNHFLIYAYVGLSPFPVTVANENLYGSPAKNIRLLVVTGILGRAVTTPPQKKNNFRGWILAHDFCLLKLNVPCFFSNTKKSR